MLKIKTASTVVDVGRGGSPEFRVHASFRGHRVNEAHAAISSFGFNFLNGDHSIEALGISVVSVEIHGDSDRVSVVGQANFHDRGGMDDPYQVRVSFLIFADVD